VILTTILHINLSITQQLRTSRPINMPDSAAASQRRLESAFSVLDRRTGASTNAKSLVGELKSSMSDLTQEE
jgi:hypothetical protein